MGKLKHPIIVGVLTLISATGLYFLFNWMFTRPDPASAQAAPIENLFQAHFIMMAFLFALIMVIMLYAVVVFRRRPGDDTDGPHIHGHTGLEIAWTIIPTIVVVGFGVYGWVLFDEVTAEQPDEMVVEVVGRQWSWSFEYPEADVRSARLVVPVNQPILLEMYSEDVLHSFWVPEFRVKQDLVPGMMMPLRITPTEIGNYRLQCAEICGTSHSDMLADVQVVSQADFEQFLIDSAFRYSDLSDEARGEQFYFDLGCNGCHSLDGSVNAGPTWQGVYLREELLDDGTTVIADDEYIRDSILNPDAQIVQGFNPGIMSAQDFVTRIADLEAEILRNEGVEIDVIADLIAFMQTLDQ
ncbi:cytochrome c oxidase subunit II [Candidatus Leptofilum sp.]|uniref:cytochrome c oxidase subunit II n=1 Tax=Candidatus Leptofilum sp. TaxID=3241576 RepID=UPI003B58C6E2